ncbi:MAG: ABC transporter ATP-binding protein [Chloroflexota bacterium]|nr:ABC transporter ATP-binding protein [Chloroflexota bacterium]
MSDETESQPLTTPETPQLVVATENLTKRYGNFTALENLNLQIETGAIFGFIGPNGAGKTTTMRILATLLEPTSGDAQVCGYSVVDRDKENQTEIRRRIGYMPDFFGVYDRMKVWEYLEFFASAYYVEVKKRFSLINDLLALVDLSDKRGSFVEGLSRGMKQRLGLARCLIHDPALLILDEPASGLDPRARVELRELLKELSRMGKTILISSHILTELAEMCSHIGIIERGHLLTSGRVSDILRNVRQERRVVILKVQALTEHLAPLEALIAQGPGVLELKPVVTTPLVQAEKSGWSLASWELQLEGHETELNNLLRYLVGQNVPIYSFAEQEDDLEDIFLKVTKGLVS